LKQHQATILLGTNIGEKRKNLNKAISLLKQYCGVVTKESSIYESDAWGKEDQESFYNKIIIVKTIIPPIFLMKTMLDLEKKMGRIREEKWGPRLIDMDLLFYENKIVHSKTLELPHPGISKRNFTLLPLVEINPIFLHPTLNCTIQDLLSQSKDPLTAKRIK
jgi:2-amino-4-hydroxy-6-hydroxymethyldihydropteridine diphosphokinase